VIGELAFGYWFLAFGFWLLLLDCWVLELLLLVIVAGIGLAVSQS
jgi:hypothetical protein